MVWAQATTTHRLPKGREGVEDGPPHANARRAHRKRLENVAAASHATVHHDLKPRRRTRGAQCRRHLVQHLETRTTHVQLPSAVVAHDDAVNASSHG
jgi:hypothetical protein